jgi:tRNA-Thr(GGU) m(6)t(6)A37 methyltransferase TsaA
VTVSSDAGPQGLSAKDRKLVLAALNAGNALERVLSNEGASGATNEISNLSETFRQCLMQLASADSTLARKQADLSSKVAPSSGAKHIFGLLVPLERLLNRAARDEEFLYHVADQKTLSPEARAIKDELPRIVICENLRSAFNVGAIFRTAECFLANEIWLTGYTAPPQKTAMGADEHVPWKCWNDSTEAIHRARECGFKIIALEVTEGAQSVDEFNWPEKSALVLGNERFGLDSATLELCDSVVKIPTQGIKNSLNVGIAFGIAASTWRKPTLSAESGKALFPIGYVRGGHLSPQAAPRQGTYQKSANFSSGKAIAEVELVGKFRGGPANFETALQNLKGFDRVWLMFGFHTSQSWRPLTRPPRGDGTLKGVFATRSPHRPNGLGLSCVKLLDVQGRTLLISEHDLLEGTPIYDIKPYVPEADAFPDVAAGWLDQLEPPLEIKESVIASEKLNWLSNAGESRLRPFLFEQLRYQPLDASRKRIEILEDEPRSSDEPNSNLPRNSAFRLLVAFRTWRFVVTVTPSFVDVEDVFSGYDDKELLDANDLYLDKALHIKFRKEFPSA